MIYCASILYTLDKQNTSQSPSVRIIMFVFVQLERYYVWFEWCIQISYIFWRIPWLSSGVYELPKKWRCCSQNDI